MKRTVICGILLTGIFSAYVWYNSSNSFEFKVNYIKHLHGPPGKDALATGKVEKGTLNVGDEVKVKRDGKTIKTAIVRIILKNDTGREIAIKSISKEDNEEVSIGLDNMDEEVISINDLIVK